MGNWRSTLSESLLWLRPNVAEDVPQRGEVDPSLLQGRAFDNLLTNEMCLCTPMHQLYR